MTRRIRQWLVVRGQSAVVSRRLPLLIAHCSLFIAIVFTLLAAATAWADPAADHYNRGNHAFEQKDYEQALSAYEAAYDAGADDPDLFLNMGNAAFRLNRLGVAVWAYEMGLRLAPRDGDLRFNLRYAEANQRDELPKGDEVFILRAGRALASWFTAGEATAVAALAWLALGLVAMRWLRAARRDWLIALAGAALAVLVLFGPLAGWRLYQQYGMKSAVIVADKAVARTAPAPDAAEAFTAHGGLNLEVIDERDVYSRVRLPNGMEGWMEKAGYRPLRR
jgi:cytochrome c-type biogenesis protein CcmH/NrfG